MSVLASRLGARPRSPWWIMGATVIAGAVFLTIRYLSTRTEITPAPPSHSLPLARDLVLLAAVSEPPVIDSTIPRRDRDMAITGPPGESVSQMRAIELRLLRARGWTALKTILPDQEHWQPASLHAASAIGPGAIVSMTSSDRSVWASFSTAASTASLDRQEDGSRLYGDPAIANAIRAHQPVLLVTLIREP